MKLFFNFRFLIPGFLLLYALPAAAVEFSGYISGMPSIIAMHPGGDTWHHILVHNRLNFGQQMTDSLRVDVGMRNRFITGSEAMLDPQGISHDPGWADLSWNWAEGSNALANTSFDRAFVTYEKDRLRLQVGRQRINWGQTFVWNPNDIFNTYSFFDFDYPERPGTDAFRGTYHHSATSSSEVAMSVNHENKITAAILHRWNSNNVDYQVIVGELAETDFVLGGSVTTDVMGLNLRSEISYFHPIKDRDDNDGTVAISVGADYIFSNSLMLQIETLYNSIGKNQPDNGLAGLYAVPLSAKNLSVSEWNLFAQVSYPITPRLNGALSGMYFVDIQSYYAGVSLDYSLAANLDLSFIAQYFASFDNSLPNTQMFMGFTRLKYSF